MYQNDIKKLCLATGSETSTFEIAVNSTANTIAKIGKKLVHGLFDTFFK